MSVEKDIDRLAVDLADALGVVAWPDERLHVVMDEVSAWSPAEHMSHVARALECVRDFVAMLEEGRDPAILRVGHPSIAGRMVLVTGWIPRGRAETPEAFAPEPRPPRAVLRDALRQSERAYAELRPRARALGTLEGRILHPRLGPFDATEWVRYAHVHTRHHLGIVAEIDRRRAVGVPAPVVGLGGSGEAGAGA